METTIRVDKEIQQRLKIKSAELGCTQFQLANRYLLDGLMADSISSKPVKSLEEIRELLDFDLPEGNSLDSIDGIFEGEKDSD